MGAYFTAVRRLSPAVAPLFAVLAGVVALAVAYGSQYIGGLNPCQMCYWQRIPYALVIVLGILAFFLRNSKKSGYSLLVWLCYIALLAGAALGFFHAGVEYGWWEGPTACAGSLTAEMSMEELRAKILGAPTVSCKDAAIRVLSISMAGWNGIYGLCSAIILLILIKKTIRR